MKILITGGATGGHFYPLIAIVEALRAEIKKEHILEPKIYFMAPSEYNPRLLYDHDITFIKVSAGKIRRYSSFLNFIDLFRTAFGVIEAIIKMWSIFPDVVVGKGGFASFPALFAARFLGIPVIIHESDSRPGKVNLWASKFAKKIAVSYPSAMSFFPKDKVACTGNPVREGITHPITQGAEDFLKLEANIPVILILGGSQGAQNINEKIMDILPSLVKKYVIIHQTGVKNFDWVKKLSTVILSKVNEGSRYKPFPYLNDLAMRMSAGSATIVISRAGSTIFEIASWALPSIIIPIDESISHDQKSNAFAYASTGSAVVIEDKNLSGHILESEIDRLVGDKDLRIKMSESARQFFEPQAALKIARATLNLALEHER